MGSRSSSSVEVELRGHTIQGTLSDGEIDAFGGSAGLYDIEIEGPGTLTQGFMGVNLQNVHHSRVRGVTVVQNTFGIGVNASDFSSAASIAATASAGNEFRDNVVSSNYG